MKTEVKLNIKRFTLLQVNKKVLSITEY